MQLDYVENLDQFQEEYLERVWPVRVYFCFSSRNAWHDTKSRKYRPGCIHTRLETAQKYAEAQRIQGSVFFIRQLPALLLMGYPHAVITEINANEPLSGYSRSATRLYPGFDFKDDSLEEGNSMRQVVDSFRYNSPFWTTPPRPKNSVVTLFYDEDPDDLEDLDQGSLSVWKSRSIGPAELRWDKLKSRIKGNAILKLRSFQ